MSKEEEAANFVEEEEDEAGAKAKGFDDYSQRRLEELLKNLWRATLVLLVYALFCFLSLAQPDASFLRPGGTIKMPFANVDVSYGAFFFFGPILLGAILFYLHILLGEWQKIGIGDYDRQPIYIFNIPSLLPKLITNFTFYVLGPSLLLGFAFKSRIWTNVGSSFWLLATFLMATVLLKLYLLRKAAGQWTTLSALAVLTVCFGVLGATRGLVLLVPLQVAGADLSKQDLRNVDLRAMNASGANLSLSVLEGTDMSRANLLNSNLEGARLSDSRLVEANLEFANLKGATLSSANLNHANLRNAILEGADFRYAVLSGADMRQVNLSNADLTGADLTNANLSQALIKGTKLAGAILTGVDLSRAQRN